VGLFLLKVLIPAATAAAPPPAAANFPAAATLAAAAAAATAGPMTCRTTLADLAWRRHCRRRPIPAAKKVAGSTKPLEVHLVEAVSALKAASALTWREVAWPGLESGLRGATKHGDAMTEAAKARTLSAGAETFAIGMEFWA